MIFRQLFDRETCTYTYLLADEASRDAVIIDPVFEQHQRDLALIQELDLKLKYCLDTHCHADHVTAAWVLREKTGCVYGLAKANKAKFVDMELVGGEEIKVGSFTIKVIATPGHTSGCLSFLVDKSVFTGDCLFVRGCGRSDFQSGDPKDLYHSIREKLFSLTDDTVVYPGHDYNGCLYSTIGEEKKHNPRIGGKANETDFVGFMNNLNLPHPKKIAEALPANLKSGKPNSKVEESWAPIIHSYAGVPQVDPQWVEQNLSSLQVIDVRNEEELIESGFVDSSINIPLDQLVSEVDKLNKDQNTVIICRSGRRSAQAVKLLQKEQFTKIANVRGGILDWIDEGLRIVSKKAK